MDTSEGGADVSFFTCIHPPVFKSIHPGKANSLYPM